MLPAMRSLAGERLLAFTAIAVVAGLSVHEWIAGRAHIHATLAAPRGAAVMTAGDSAHYLQIARSFAAGDLSFSYVAPTGGADLAHRQPLYPALLAITMKVGGDGLETLASVNLAILVAALWAAYAVGARALYSPLAGMAAAAALWRVPFLFENATTRLLTEPGYVLCGLLVAWGFLAHQAQPRRATLVLTASALASAYLQRTNGLFLAASTLVVLSARDIGRTWCEHCPVPNGPMLRRWWLSALLVLTVLTIPSWLPRAIYAGRPFYHGYLPNYLWVDDYERAHAAGAPRYEWRDYAREHDVRAAESRMSYGLRRTLWQSPREKYGVGVASAMLVGIVLALFAADRRVPAWLGVGLLQVIPLAWTALSNPTQRIPAAALLPFGLVAIAAGTDVVLGRVPVFRRNATRARLREIDASPR
jgi:hypothetical protein